MMYSTDYGSSSTSSRRSVASVRGLPPVTPDSVVGTELLDGGGRGVEVPRKAPNAPSAPTSAPSSAPPSVPPSAAHHLPSAQLLSIFQTESSEQYRVTPSYLHSTALIPPGLDSRELGVSERCRRRTCEWMYDICDYFRLNREVVGIALFYVDRYFTLAFAGAARPGARVTGPVTRRRFQLVALTSLYVAVKLHGESRQEGLAPRGGGGPGGLSPADEHRRPWNRLKFSLVVCASISRSQFAPAEIEMCECDLLTALDWHVNPVVASGTVVDSLLAYLPASAPDDRDGGVAESLSLFVYDCAKYLAELSVSVPALSLVYKPSVVAYASISYALDALDLELDSCFVALDRRQYEGLVRHASDLHFDREAGNVEGAKRILRAICPNLDELFPPPTLMPASPTAIGFP